MTRFLDRCAWTLNPLHWMLGPKSWTLGAFTCALPQLSGSLGPLAWALDLPTVAERSCLGAGPIKLEVCNDDPGPGLVAWVMGLLAVPAAQQTGVQCPLARRLDRHTRAPTMSGWTLSPKSWTLGLFACPLRQLTQDLCPLAWAPGLLAAGPLHMMGL